MAEPHVISALVKKRAELSGDIEHYEQIIKEYKENLLTIDKTIGIFDENYNISSIKTKRTYRGRYFKNGEAKVATLDILRGSDKPLQTDEIADIIAKDKGMEFDSTNDFKNFQKSVSTALKNLKESGLANKINDGLPGIWQIKAVS